MLEEVTECQERADKQEITGQVLHIRSSSKSVIWLHFQINDNQQSRIEVICKASESPAILALFRHTLKVGDIVTVIGNLEVDLFHAFGCTMVEKYSKATPFIPIPPEQNTAGKEVSEVCKFWINTGRCWYGAECTYLHPAKGDELKKARREWLINRRKVRDALADPDDPHISTGKESHGHRADLFSEWLLATFSDFSKVLDVAGGRGCISIDLFIKKQISTILIDPRDDCIRPDRHQHKVLKARKLNPTTLHLKSFFPVDGHDDASLLFGMHPDQATEPILDFALAHKISFAIVPCCVFARENTHRMIGDKAVVSYEDYIEYLMAKDSGIMKCYLGFEGRNVCLYKVY